MEEPTLGLRALEGEGEGEGEVGKGRLSPALLYKVPTSVRLPGALFRRDGRVPTLVALAVNHEYLLW